MDQGNDKASIELGMKVSIRRSGRSFIGVVTKIGGEYVIVRWTNSDLGETAEYEAHRGDVDAACRLDRQTRWQNG